MDIVPKWVQSLHSFEADLSYLFILSILLPCCFSKEITTSAVQKYRSHRHFGYSCTQPSQTPLPAAAAQPPRVEFWVGSTAAAAKDESNSAAPSAGVERLMLPVPYQVPPVRYGPQDRPWMTGVPYPGLDSHGLTLGQSYDRNSHYGHVEPDD